MTNTAAPSSPPKGESIVETQPSDMRHRAVALIQEAGTLLSMVPDLLDRNEELQASVETSSKQNEELRGEVAALRTELQQMRTDRQETADSLMALMNDILRLTSEGVAKLRPTERRSAFLREASPLGESPQARPTSPLAAAWRKEG